MKKTDKLNTLIPLDQIEKGALEQIFENLADERLLKMAIMPDVHKGYDLPIGGVALVDRHVSPSYVGYDIGCGMCAINTGIQATELFPDQRSKQELFSRILKQIPVGLGGRRDKAPFPAFESEVNDPAFVGRVNKGVQTQIGTLGSGNHFIEISNGSDGLCWITIHSGSRNVGHTVGSWYMQKTKKLNDKFLSIESRLGQLYLNDMDYCLEFALENRRRMITDLLRIMEISDHEIKRLLKDVMINENHNHAIVRSDGTVLHRKGATPADKGQLGIIPANMRDGIYMTEGLGNETYLSSASHGAGRVMSRKEANRTIRLDDFKKTMQGIIARVDKGTIDEAPFAYKEIHKVIAAQEGIVIKVLNYLQPLINIKG
ncbi:MAG: RtcB family protein [Desulfuromonadales bacterium]|nr:RtcB family protein [Desulfuromonadales bacterium]